MTEIPWAKFETAYDDPIKFLGKKPPVFEREFDKPLSRHFQEQALYAEHFRGALLEAADLIVDLSKLTRSQFRKKYNVKESWFSSKEEEIVKMLRVSAGESVGAKNK